MANEDYLEMIELPVSTCEMVVVPKKKRFLKKRLVKSVNKKLKKFKPDAAKDTAIDMQGAPEDREELSESNVILYEKKQKKKLKFDIVAAQVVAVFALIVAIILTNVFWENSGINSLVRSVFSQEKTVLDERAYTAFSASLPCAAQDIAVKDGVMTVKGSAAVYSPADGVVESFYEKDGKTYLTVKHSEKFKSVISGLDHAYVSLGEKVYKGIPVGYLGSDECKVAMYEGDELITNYSLSDGVIVWKN